MQKDISLGYSSDLRKFVKIGINSVHCNGVWTQTGYFSLSHESAEPCADPIALFCDFSEGFHKTYKLKSLKHPEHFFGSTDLHNLKIHTRLFLSFQTVLLSMYCYSDHPASFWVINTKKASMCGDGGLKLNFPSVTYIKYFFSSF